MIIAANWKQYLSPGEESELLVEFGNNLRLHNGQELVVFPSLYSLQTLTKTAKELALPIVIGAQDIAPMLDGTLTGGTRADFVENEVVLIGHSERRKVFHEKIADIKKKLQVALDCSKKVILCVGEKKPVGDDDLLVFLQKELNEYAEIVKGRTNQVIIAYEPWWAVGGNKTPTVQTIQKVVKLLNNLGFAQVLYGGSVDPNTVMKIVCPELSGFLIGRASTTLTIFQSLLDQLANQ